MPNVYSRILKISRDFGKILLRTKKTKNNNPKDKKTKQKQTNPNQLKDILILLTQFRK